MRKGQNHIIIKETLDFELPEQEGSYELQNELRDIVLEVHEDMEALFDLYSDPDVVVYLEELIIDIGDVTRENLKQEVHRQIKIHLNDLLVEKLYKIKTGDTTEGKIMSRDEHNIRSLIAFLKTGLVTASDQNFMVVLSEYLKNQGDKLLFKAVFEDEKCLERLVKQFPDALIADLFKYLFDHATDVNLITELHNKFGRKGTLMGWDLAYFVVKTKNGHPDNELVAKLLVRTSQRLKITTKAAFDLLHAVFKFNDESVDVLQNVYKKIGSSEREEIKMPLLRKPEVPEETIYVGNAGLVILSAYINPFFDNLGFLKEGLFVDEEMQEKAMHLLQYCATFQDDTPEYDLVLNKLLCGIDPNQPVEFLSNLSDHEKREARELLKSVADNWDAIGKTSAEGVRQTFLNREGALSFQGDYWLLRVEKKTVDVLIEKIPWNISVLKHKWMEYPIHVEW